MTIADLDEDARSQDVLLSGRAAVREYLLAPLAGLPRKRGTTALDHSRNLDKLTDALAYMSRLHLCGLCELVLRHSNGKAGPVWPDIGLVRSWAIVLQQPPPRKSDYAQSLIASAMGRQAQEEGWLVELFQVAKRLGPPPGKYILSQLRVTAAENIRLRVIVRDRIQRGAASAADQAWLADYWFDLAECEAILAAGLHKANGESLNETREAGA